MRVATQYPGASIDTICFFASREKMVKESPVLKVKEVKKYYTLDEVINEIAKIFGVDKERIFEKNRTREWISMRRIFYYTARITTGESLKTIGAFMGARDHTTVIHSIKKMQDTIDARDDFFMSMWTKYLFETKILT